jgi:hypothetical protein
MPLSSIDLSTLVKVGVGLQRPEDVVVGRDDRVWASDQWSACTEIPPDGSLCRPRRAVRCRPGRAGVQDKWYCCGVEGDLNRRGSCANS